MHMLSVIFQALNDKLVIYTKYKNDPTQKTSVMSALDLSGGPKIHSEAEEQRKTKLQKVVPRRVRTISVLFQK